MRILVNIYCWYVFSKREFMICFSFLFCGIERFMTDTFFSGLWFHYVSIGGLSLLSLMAFKDSRERSDVLSSVSCPLSNVLQSWTLGRNRIFWISCFFFFLFGISCLDMPFSGTIYLDTLVELNYILSPLSYRTQYDFGVAGEVDDGMGELWWMNWPNISG